jgi:hypothetical protein
MTLNEVLVAIRSTDEFKIEFIKRSTGALRLIRATLQPPDMPAGSGSKVDTVANRLINIYDLDDRKFKSIPIDGIRRVEINGNWIDVLQSAGNAAAG